jgi:hypothetical protein
MISAMRLALAFALALTACTGMAAEVDCRAITDRAVCDRTPGCHFRMVYVCVPYWRLKQRKRDPYGVMIELINRRRVELHFMASGRIGCFPNRR